MSARQPSINKSLSAAQSFRRCSSRRIENFTTQKLEHNETAGDRLWALRYRSWLRDDDDLRKRNKCCYRRLLTTPRRVINAVMSENTMRRDWPRMLPRSQLCRPIHNSVKLRSQAKSSKSSRALRRLISRHHQLFSPFVCCLPSTVRLSHSLSIRFCFKYFYYISRISITEILLPPLDLLGNATGERPYTAAHTIAIIKEKVFISLLPLFPFQLRECNSLSLANIFWISLAILSWGHLVCLAAW